MLFIPVLNSRSLFGNDDKMWEASSSHIQSRTNLFWAIQEGHKNLSGRGWCGIYSDNSLLACAMQSSIYLIAFVWQLFLPLDFADISLQSLFLLPLFLLLFMLPSSQMSFPEPRFRISQLHGQGQVQGHLFQHLWYTIASTTVCFVGTGFIKNSTWAE